MVEISDRSSSFGFVSAAGVRRGARALADVSAAAGSKVELTQASLRPQANDLQQLGSRVGQMAVALNGIEEARGIVRTSELSQSLQLATRRAVNRMLQAESLVNARMNTGVIGAPGNEERTVASALSSSLRDDTSGGAIARVLANAIGGANQKKPTPFSILATAATSSRKLGDIFDRTLPTRVEAQGRATIGIDRRSLQAAADRVVIDPNDPDSFIATARIVDAGRPSRSNEGFIVRASTGPTNGLIAIDLSDPNGEDTRLATADISGGDGSDVIFLSGANDARIRAGGGNDFVVADGNTQIFGGAGDDVLVGNYVFGEDGDDVLFGNTLAMGGAGNDRITMFSIDPENDGDGLAFGGDGDDIIIGEVRISADGGDGNDAISLRAGGFASGGAGNDTLTSFGDATLEGGAGNDDIMLLGTGRIDAGDGDDDITATFYATVKGGKGNDIVRMNTGGIYQYAKGDGFDRVLIGAATTGRLEDWAKTNRVEMSGFARGDVDIFVGENDVTIVSRDPDGPQDPQRRDRLTVTRTLPGDALDIVFTKDGKTQTVSIRGTTQTLGPLNNVLPA